METEDLQTSGEPAAIHVDTFRRLMRAREFIDQCYHQPLDVEQISGEACLSRYHFLRLFRRAFNKMFEEEAANQLRALIAGGKLGAGVFDTPNCQATYEELSAKGVEFLSPPAERPYGIEAIFKDNTGNWFSLAQHKED